jgi:uncharacterized protein (DUF983 family)
MKPIVPDDREAHLSSMLTSEIATIEPAAARPWLRAMARGFVGRCPHCGKGRLFGRFLKPVATCSVCDEDFTHQRADDAPPYFTMVIVGHLVVPVMVATILLTNLSTTTYLLIWLPTIAILTVGLLQPVKGAIIAFQWALRMHGFDGKGDDAADFQSFP